MTFEEFSAQLPVGISGGMIRTIDGHWVVKFWRKYEGSPPGGLAFCELAAVVERRRWRKMTDDEIAAFVATLPP